MKQCCRPGCDNLALSATNARCGPCHTAYMRDWRRVAKERSARAAYNLGMEEMRTAIMRDFEQIGDREMNGRTASAIARQCVVS